jgi:hypothetical protein
MRPIHWIEAVFLVAVLGGRGVSGQQPCAAPPRQTVWQWLAPAGGWDPYGGGLLRWWNPCCFPRGGGPDDYCRTPLPNVCWPPYPPYFIGGPPPTCPPPQERSADREAWSRRPAGG